MGKSLFNEHGFYSEKGKEFCVKARASLKLLLREAKDAGYKLRDTQTIILSEAGLVISQFLIEGILERAKEREEAGADENLKWWKEKQNEQSKQSKEQEEEA